MSNWIAASQTPSGDVIGVHQGDDGTVLIGSVTAHFSEEPGAYFTVEYDDIPALIEVLREAFASLAPGEN